MLHKPACHLILPDAIGNLARLDVPVTTVLPGALLTPGSDATCLGDVEVAEPQLAATMSADLLSSFHSWPLPSMSCFL